MGQQMLTDTVQLLIILGVNAEFKMTEELYEYSNLPSHKAVQRLSNGKVLIEIFWAQAETEIFLKENCLQLLLSNTK